MNIINFKAEGKPIVFCIVDDSAKAANGYIKEIIKNQADYTVNNINAKDYDVVQGLDADNLLKYVSTLGYSHAVVISMGTEFINGNAFFDAVEQLARTDFLVAGHILDMGDAYYNLHHQCFVVNLAKYTSLGCPAIGEESLGNPHTQVTPLRSTDNYHDSYTPLTVNTGTTVAQYNHKCYGWNMISVALEHESGVVVFDDAIRSSKLYVYPRSQHDFNKNAGYLYKRQSYCAAEFIHKDTTDRVFYNGPTLKQVVTPASGNWFTQFHEADTQVVVYDYNSQTLNYWKEQLPYKFVTLDLLGNEVDWSSVIDTSVADRTLVNLTNIFAYEGTACFASLQYRLAKENEIIKNLQALIPEGYISFDRRAWQGYRRATSNVCKIKDCEIVEWKDLLLPTWHLN